MKIAVAASFISGVEYYRLVVPYMALAAYGHEIVFVNRIITANDAEKWRADGIDAEPGALLAPRGKGVEVVRADALVLSRTSSTEWIDTIPALQRMGTTVIVDLDDNHHAITAKNPFFRDVVANSPKIDRVIRMADVLTTSTRAIAEEYGPMRSGMTKVIPNRLDIAQYEKWRQVPTSTPAVSGQIRIGWAGSPTHEFDLLMVRDALLDVAKEYPQVRIVLIGPTLNTPIGARLATAFSSRIGADRIESIPGAWLPADAVLHEGDEIADNCVTEAYRIIDRAGLDIAIAPLEPTAFNRARSSVKLLEYGMLGIPTVASNFGSYAEHARWAHLRHGPTVLLADGRKEWRAHLRALLADGMYRQRIATAAQAEIEHHAHLAAGVDLEEMLRSFPSYTKPFVAI